MKKIYANLFAWTEHIELYFVKVQTKFLRYNLHITKM